MIHHSSNSEQQIPFDSDFDEADHAEIVESGANSGSVLSSKQAFAAGLISAVLTIGTIGFIILVVRLVYS